MTVGIVRNVTRHCTFCYGYDKATGTYSPNMSGMKALQQTMQSVRAVYSVPHSERSIDEDDIALSTRRE